jgi:hypothetical protein
VESTAWPVSIVIAVILFREELRKLIPYIEEINIKDLNVKLSKRLLSAERVQLQTSETTQSIAYKTPSIIDKIPHERLIQLAEVSPRAGILEAWSEHEKAIYFLASKLNLDAKNYRNLESLMSKIQEITGTKSLFEHTFYLRKVRNKVAHDVDTFSQVNDEIVETAQNYVALACMTAAYITRWTELYKTPIPKIA